VLPHPDDEEMTAPAPTPIVPRWEWRTFDERFGEADIHFAALSPDRAQESDEVYLLSLASDASVKVRDGLMDVKRLERVNDDGLEQWKPVMKASFPLGAPDVAAVFASLGAAVPPLERREYTFDELVAEVVRTSDDLIAVEVHKRRERYTIGGCMAELSEVRTAQGARRTIAVESEDEARVITAVRELGLGARRNVNMARGLKALVGFGSRNYAAIDVGTNSVKFYVGEGLRTASGAQSSTGPMSRASARGWTRLAGSSRRRWSGPSMRSPRWPTRPRRTTPRQSQQSGPPGSVSRPTARAF
jgi:exopolyphosphatase / guanosine-5'-triphosphate,3'-diphosphate pyrophosphatase